MVVFTKGSLFSLQADITRGIIVRRSDTTSFIKRATQRHGDKYDYSESQYTNSGDEITIICSTHGRFNQEAGRHLNGQGCPGCKLALLKTRYNLTTKQFIEKAIDVHGSKYDYSRVNYTMGRKKVEIICSKPKHGSFMQRASHHLGGHGCPECSSSVSIVETEWLDSLGIKERQKRFKLTYANQRSIIVDGYDPLTNTVYEFHGDYWHGNPDLFNSDEQHPTRIGKTYGNLYVDTHEKEEAILAAGFNLVTIWENDWKTLRKESSTQD